MGKIIPDVVAEQHLRSLGPRHTAREAAQLMIDADISAIPVLDAEERLIGLVTERDLARRVVAAGLNPADALLGEVMSADPDTIAPETSPMEALEQMLSGRYRHLPVIRDGRVVGIVTMRDLRHGIAREYKTDHAAGGRTKGLWNRLTG